MEAKHTVVIDRGCLLVVIVPARDGKRHRASGRDTEVGGGHHQLVHAVFAALRAAASGTHGVIPEHPGQGLRVACVGEPHELVKGKIRGVGTA